MDGLGLLQSLQDTKTKIDKQYHLKLDAILYPIYDDDIKEIQTYTIEKLLFVLRNLEPQGDKDFDAYMSHMDNIKQAYHELTERLAAIARLRKDHHAELTKEMDVEPSDE